MKINPDSPDLQRQIDPAATPSETGKAFAGTLAAKGQPNLGTSNIQPSTGPAQGLNKQDLTDPAKASAAVDQAVQEMMEREFRGMCNPDREQVAAWLRSDPIVRDALLKRLKSSGR